MTFRRIRRVAPNFLLKFIFFYQIRRALATDSSLEGGLRVPRQSPSTPN